MTGADLARAAESLVGARFRLHGRDPAHGLDCVGVVAASFARAGRPVEVPTEYRLRHLRIDKALGFAARAGLVETAGEPLAGDILLARPAPAQRHLLIAGRGDRFIHAHAGLRRVVATPGPPAWPILRHWRLEGLT